MCSSKKALAMLERLAEDYPITYSRDECRERFQEDGVIVRAQGIESQFFWIQIRHGEYIVWAHSFGPVGELLREYWHAHPGSTESMEIMFRYMFAGRLWFISCFLEGKWLGEWPTVDDPYDSTYEEHLEPDSFAYRAWTKGERRVYHYYVPRKDGRVEDLPDILPI